MEPIIYVLLSLAILALLCVCVALIILREKAQDKFTEERAVWAKERHDLNNRLMSRDWTSYLALVAAESETLATEAEKEAEREAAKTNDYDKAWSA